MAAITKYGSEVNDIQAAIMRELFSHPSLRFSEINTDNVPNDQFSYHLRQLIKYGLVEKSDDQRYSLSVLGCSRAIMLDNHVNKFIQQGFVACRVLLNQDTSEGRKYLMQRRIRVPYQGYLGEPGGKILFGEDVLQAARRNMIAETGLDCQMELRGLVHYKDKYQDRIVQDKYFFVVAASHPKGDLKPASLTGENIWLTMEEIKAAEKIHQGVLEMIQMRAQPPFGFYEATHEVAEY